MIRQRGFTLIELLVVISIIGLLSSVVLAALNSARGKAKVGAALQFSTTFNHTLASELIGEWTFDEGTGNTANDTSGNGAVGIISGSGVWPAGIHGTALTFDGSNNVVTTSTGLKNPFYGTGGYAVGAWVKIQPNNNSSFMTITNRGNSSNSLPWATFGYSGLTNVLRLKWTGGVAGTTDSNSLPISIEDGKWHFVALSASSGTSPRFYLDGNEVTPVPGTNAVYGEPTLYITNITAAPFMIGARDSNIDKFQGDIDEVRIYSQPFDWLK